MKTKRCGIQLKEESVEFLFEYDFLQFKSLEYDFLLFISVHTALGL